VDAESVAFGALGGPQWQRGKDSAGVDCRVAEYWILVGVNYWTGSFRRLVYGTA
jgi:hypothetical protein